MNQPDPGQLGPQDQGQLFQRLDIPIELDNFPGGDEYLVEAAEVFEISEAARGVEQLIWDCDNCANITSNEKQLLSRIKALEKTKQYLQKKTKDHINETSNCRTLLEVSVKENVVLKRKLDTSESLKVVKQTEIIYLVDKEASTSKIPHTGDKESLDRCG